MDTLLIQLIASIGLLDGLYMINIRDGVILITADDTDYWELLSVVYGQAILRIQLIADCGIQSLQRPRFLSKIHTKRSVQRKLNISLLVNHFVCLS